MVYHIERCPPLRVARILGRVHGKLLCTCICIYIYIYIYTYIYIHTYVFMYTMHICVYRCISLSLYLSLKTRSLRKLWKATAIVAAITESRFRKQNIIIVFKTLGTTCYFQTRPDSRFRFLESSVSPSPKGGSEKGDPKNNYLLSDWTVTFKLSYSRTPLFGSPFGGRWVGTTQGTPTPTSRN